MQESKKETYSRCISLKCYALIPLLYVFPLHRSHFLVTVFYQPVLLRRLSGYFSPCLCACRSVDDRFPPDATVEFIFSDGPEKMKGEYYRLSVFHCILWCFLCTQSLSFYIFVCVISKRLLSKVENTARMTPPLKWTTIPQTRWSGGILMRILT